METSSVPYDDQSPSEQAETRARWDAQIAETRASLNYEQQFRSEGRTYSEAAPDGTLIQHVF